MSSIHRYYRNLYISPARRAIRALLLLILLLLVSVGIAFGILRFSASSFYRKAVREIEIPGFEAGLVPQGLTYLPEEDLYLISGYRSEDGVALLAYTAPDGTRQGLIPLTGEDGMPLVLHSGGIAAGEERLYIAGCDGYCYVLAYSDFPPEGDGVLSVTGRFPAGNRADFCFFSDGHLYIGEFYHPIKFPTDEAHHTDTPAGERHYALMLAYPADAVAVYGIRTEADAAYSIPGRIQGGCREGDTIVLSSSSFLERTYLAFFSLAAAEETAGEYRDGERILPLYHLDSQSRKSTLTLPPMSEGVCIRNGRITVVFESAAGRFLSFGRLFGGEYLWSLPVE